MEKQIWQKYRERGLQVFGVNAGERSDPEKNARQFVTKNEVTYPTLMDTDDTMMETYKIEAFPTVAIIDRKGTLRYIQAGFSEEAVRQQVEALLAER